MTGEVTLRGRVLPIGGLQEKTMAALRNGIKTVIIPADNGKDLEEIDQTVRKALQFILVEQADQVLAEAPAPRRRRSGGGRRRGRPCPRPLQGPGPPSCGTVRRSDMAINLQKAEFVLSAARPGTFPGDGLPQVAFSGRSNVGKSSVINRLLNRKNFARVGAAPARPPTSTILTSTTPSTWWTCPATATPRCPRRSGTAGAS